MGMWWTIAFAALWGLMLLEGVLLLGVLRQLGMLHRRIDELPKVAAPLSASQGLPLGMPAPDFTLPQLGAGRRSLSDFRGRRLLLAFVSPDCGPCKELLPHLNALAERADQDELQIVAISTGGASMNEQLRARHRFQSPLLLQEDREVAALYKTTITPYLYVIDVHGVVRGHQVANTLAEVEWLVAQVQEEGTHGQVRRAPLPLHGAADLA